MIIFLCVNRYDAASMKMSNLDFQGQFTISKKDLDISET